MLATDAALRLLERLYDETGDWLLTIAAYNVGGPRLRKAVDKSQSSSFWDLRLPVETRRHVAKLLALSRVILSPEQHDLVLPELKLPSFLKTCHLKTSHFNTSLGFKTLVAMAELWKSVPSIEWKAVDIQRQLLSPPIWKTQPDNIVPIRRPMALAM